VGEQIGTPLKDKTERESGLARRGRNSGEKARKRGDTEFKTNEITILELSDSRNIKVLCFGSKGVLG